MIKVIFIDIDGTLLDNNSQASIENVEAVSKATKESIKCVLCSGRPRKKTTVATRMIDLKSYVISSNGADIYNTINNECIYKDFMDNEAIIKLYNFSCINGLRIKMQSGFNTFVNIVRKSMGEEILIDNIRDVVESNKISQCVVVGKNVEAINKVKKEVLSTEKIKIVNQSRGLIDPNYVLLPHQELYLDITNKITSKGNAITVLCNQLGIGLNEAVSIGDHVNDLTMFEVTGRSFAMGNANDYTKSKATDVTDTNNNSGVAKAIQKILKQNKKG